MATSEDVYGWSITAASNGTIDTGIVAAEGQLPSTVNNGMRGIMAALARFLKDNNGSLTSTGSANAYLLTVNGTYTALATGLLVAFKANFSCTGASTLAVTAGAALTAKAIRKIVAGGDTALASGNIIANGHYVARYDAAANGAAGAWILINPVQLLADVSGLGANVATFLATPSSANLLAALTDETGTGSVVFANTPTLVTPILGVASATSVNKVALTAPASSATLTVADGKTLTASNTLTFTGTDGSSVAFGAGGTVAYARAFVPQGRLTLATGVPVMSTTQSAKTTIYYALYTGNQIPIYDGTNMVATTFTELSVATTDTTKNPAAIGASKVNDWFVWNDSGTIRLSHSVDWTNDTTRASALTLVNGIYLNNSAITNGPGASRGTYVGTTRSNASSQLDWIFGAGAAGGTAAWLGVWNMYNRCLVTTTVADTTATWTVATSASARNLNSSATNRISFVSGLAEDGIDVSVSAGLLPINAASSSLVVGFGLDATALDKRVGAQTNSVGGLVFPGTVRHTYAPQLGFHFIQATDAGDGTNAGTVIGNLNSAFVLNWSA